MTFGARRRPGLRYAGAARQPVLVRWFAGEAWLWGFRPRLPDLGIGDGGFRCMGGGGEAFWRKALLASRDGEGEFGEEDGTNTYLARS